MSTTAATPSTIPPEEGGSLSEPQRILNTYIAPTKTFADVRRNPRWWGPWVVLAVIGYVLVFAVSQKVGFEQVTQNEIRRKPKTEARLEQIRQQDPQQYDRQIQISGSVTKVIAYVFPAPTLVVALISALVLMATFNFGVGTQIGFKHALAIVLYGMLPGVVRTLLAAATVFAGANTESFLFSNPVGTNPAYYMSVTDTPPWLYTLLSWLDIIVIWEFVLIGLGFAVVGRIAKSKGIGVLAGWFVLMMLISVGFAAFS